MGNPLLEAALEYRERYDFSIIPVRPFTKKANLLDAWTEFQDRKATPDEIRKWWSTWPEANIGIVAGAVSDLTVVDGDSDQAIQEIESNLPDSINIPIVFTPNNGHRHYYFRYQKGLLSKRYGATEIDVKNNGGIVTCPPSFSREFNKRYQWQNGCTPDQRPDLPSDLLSLLKDINNKSTLYVDNKSDNIDRQHLTTLTTNDNIYFIKGRRDEDLFTIANALIKSRLPVDIAYQTLEILAKNCNPPFPANEIKSKIESALKRSDRKERNLTAEIREWVLTTSGNFLTTNVYNCQHLTTREEKKVAAVVLRRLCDEGLIERAGNQNGCYKLCEPESEDIDFLNADTTGLVVQWPLGIEDYFKTMPKNIIMVAGEVNAGKTAFLLNLAKLNMHKFRIKYFSSEMGAAELKERLSKFEMPLKEWTKVCFKEKSSDFAREIDPEAINIIDFLEMHDEFYKMGALIREIYDKLTTGIAVIAIQKNKGRDEGLGGERSKEKARLYLAIEPGKIKMVKVKNWANPEINPNGHQTFFKLAQGCRFKKEGDWYKP